MKYYLVKTTLTATEENEYRRGTVLEMYSGKGSHTVAHITVKGDPEWHDYWYNKFDLEEYGYKRRQDALRSWCYKRDEDADMPYWKRAAEIVEVEMYERKGEER